MPELSDPPPPAVLELRALAEAARGGDPAAPARLRSLLDGHPEVWRHLGDLARHAERAWVEASGGPDELFKAAMERRLEELKSELTGPDPTPLERLLAERAGLCWLQLAYADATAAQAKDMSLRQAAYLQQRQDAAHRRFLTALGALAAARRLLPGASTVPRDAGAPEGQAGPPALPASFRVFPDGRQGEDARRVQGTSRPSAAPAGESA